MPRPTDPVKRVCYADDLTVWASGVNIPDLEVILNNYLEEITGYLKDNSLLISVPKSPVTLVTPDTHQAKIHPSIFIENSHLPLVKCPRILGVYLDPSLSFIKHSQYVAERVSDRNNILKALAGTSWGQQKETLLMTYKAVRTHIHNISVQAHKPLQIIKALTATGWGKQKETLMATYKAVMRPALEYASSVWSPIASSTSINKLQVMQNAALRTATGCTQDTNIQHLHDETLTLPIHEHLQLHASQYKQKTQHPSHPLHKHTTYFNTPRLKKTTIFNNGRYTTNIPTDPTQSLQQT